jgi:hypothetical protein
MKIGHEQGHSQFHSIGAYATEPEIAPAARASVRLCESSLDHEALDIG